MTSPALMVLYSNDAVEVRYTDQSCLQVAPCGSTFVHHESPKEVIHPAHGMKTISQRSEFVTSDYRHKLINALDFRNRFAEKPFLCKDLIMPDQIVPLYANIKEAAWPKSVDDCEIDYLPDGSVRLLSADEYASLVLSPHRQDFTVCYLSQISTEAKKTKRNQHRKPNSKAKPPERREEKLDTTLDNNPDARHPQQGNRINASTTSQYSSHVDQAQGFERDSLEMDESLSKQTRNELNFSPISFASSMRSPHRSPENQQDSNNFHRYSTPTNHGPDQNKGDEIEIGGKKSAFKHYRQMQGQGSDGSFMEVIESQKTSKSSRCLDQQSQESNRMCLNKGIPESSSKEAHLITTEAVHKHNMSKKQIINLPPSDAETPNVSPTRGPAHSSFNSQPEQESNEETSTQCLYTWVTRHFSCDECPVAWRHPLNMARSMIDQREEHEKRILNGSEMKTKKDVTNHLYSKENYCICSLPAPLPLTCPAQHLHKLQINYIIDDDKSSLDNLTTFKQGRLKVLMVEGVIFRILRLSSTRVLEVYPGDGSVIVSQGVKGLYYKHIIPFGDRSEVEERSYSIKTLPPPTPGALYHVEKLVKRANRFHNQANQEDKILTKADVCCWKQQSLVIDALPTTLLEECTVPGYGRFTAFSSGHVRIVFNDRTSLDMWCDFSKRLECCIQHSEGIHGNQCRATTGEGAMPTALKVNAELREGFCKLLLPNGQYQVVDVKKPGLYRKYTDAAIEWGLWVNSLPSQRKEFYTKWQQQKSDEQMVQKELQKIKCFNYIADHTAPNGKGRVKEKSSDGSMEQMMGRVGLNKSQGPLIATSSALKTPHSQPPLNSRSELHVHFSPPSASSHPSMSHDHSHMSLQSHHGISQSGMLPSNLEMMQGFDSVREALLKTSKVIHDIDDILDKRKS